MVAQRKYPDELRERAVKMVFEIRERDGKGHGELARVGRQLGVHPEALRSWLKISMGPAGRFRGMRMAVRMSPADAGSAWLCETALKIGAGALTFGCPPVAS